MLQRSSQICRILNYSLEHLQLRWENRVGLSLRYLVIFQTGISSRKYLGYSIANSLEAGSRGSNFMMIYPYVQIHPLYLLRSKDLLNSMDLKEVKLQVLKYIHSYFLFYLESNALKLSPYSLYMQTPAEFNNLGWPFFFWVGSRKPLLKQKTLLVECDSQGRHYIK